MEIHLKSIDRGTLYERPALIVTFTAKDSPGGLEFDVPIGIPLSYVTEENAVRAAKHWLYLAFQDAAALTKDWCLSDEEFEELTVYAAGTAGARRDVHQADSPGADEIPEIAVHDSADPDEIHTHDALKGATVTFDGHYDFDDGHANAFRFDAVPRLKFMNVFHRPSREHPDGKAEREWYVDGARVADMEAAVAALKGPPLLTPEEREALERIPRHPVPLDRLQEELAGEPHPENGFIAGTSHERVLHLLHALRAKAAIEYGCKDAPPGSEHDVATVRRVL